MKPCRTAVAGLGVTLFLVSIGWSAPGMTVAVLNPIEGPPDAPFNMPSDVAVGPTGRVYVLDGVNQRVVVYDVSGRYQFQFGKWGDQLGELQSPLGLTTGPDGKVYVADSGNHRIQVFDREGQALHAVTLPDGSGGVPPDPTDLALDAGGARLYVADNDRHRICVYDLEQRAWTSSWGKYGQGRRQFRYPFLIDMSEGYLFIVEPINTRVQVLNARGKFVNFIGAWGIEPGQLFRPKGIVTDAQRVYVTDSFLGKVEIFDRQGAYLGVLRDRQGKAVRFVTPMGVALDSQRHRLYVVELKADRVCVMNLE